MQRLRAHSGRSRAWSCVAALALAAGCGPPPPIAELGLLTTRPDVVHADVLVPDVEGEHCFRENVVSVTLRPPWRARLADHGRAVANALAKVPDANVLLDVAVRVRVEQYLLFQRICAVVQGDAARTR